MGCSCAWTEFSANKKQWQVLSATGTTHLMVISGLHVGLVAVLMMFLIRLLILPLGIRSSFGLQVGVWVGLCAALVLRY